MYLGSDFKCHWDLKHVLQIVAMLVTRFGNSHVLYRSWEDECVISDNEYV